jgi:hypothetical protein
LRESGIELAKRERMRLIVISCAVLAGCGARSLVEKDMSVNNGDASDMTLGSPRDIDMSANVPDIALAVVGDSGVDLCTNSCLAKFFESFTACFSPSGRCTASGSSGFHARWDDGAFYQTSPPTYDGTSIWKMIDSRGHSSTCLTSYGAGMQDAQSGTSQKLYCVGDDTQCRNVDVVPSRRLLFDPKTSIYTCPDGEQVSASADLSECPLLHGLLVPVPSLCKP